MTYSKKILFITITILSFLLEISQAYCIYNHLDGEASYLFVKECLVNRNVSFKRRINNGEKECCPWDNGECNPSSRRAGMVDFHIKFGFNGDSLEGTDTFLARCSGGGGLILTGNNASNITATCNHANGFIENRIISSIE